jgi:hypothetical protein
MAVNMSAHASGWPEVELESSPARGLVLAAGGIGFTFVCGAMAFGAFEDVTPPSQEQLVGWAGLILFPLSAVFWLKQAFTQRPVVTVGPLGVRDLRVSPNWIPWAAITGISEIESAGSHFLMLRIDPAFEATMSLTHLVRWTKPLNAMLGYKGYFINAGGLKGGFAPLKHAVADGWSRAGGR